MTDDPLTAGQRLAGELMRRRPADGVFAARLRQRLETWGVDRDAFLGQVESVVVMALLAAVESREDDTPEAWCTAAAAVLRRQESAELFAALPSRLPGTMKLRVDQLLLVVGDVSVGDRVVGVRGGRPLSPPRVEKGPCRSFA